MPASSSNTSGRKRSLLRGDIAPAARPEISLQQWSDRMEALELLRAWAETRALDAISWYLRDKQAKRWASRLLRALAVALAVAGGVLPLLSGSVHGLNPNLGYVLLAVAAGSLAFDHFFGLSTGWMRDIAALQALQNGLARFHLDWAKWQVTHGALVEGRMPDTSSDPTSAALELIEGFVTGVSQVTDAETAQWIADFSVSVAALRKQASPSVTSPQDLITWSGSGQGDVEPG